MEKEPAQSSCEARRDHPQSGAWRALRMENAIETPGLPWMSRPENCDPKDSFRDANGSGGRITSLQVKKAPIMGAMNFKPRNDVVGAFDPA